MELPQNNIVPKSSVQTLLDLVKENPDLPVIPMINSEIVASYDYNYYVGSFANCEIGYYYCSDERIYLDESELVDDILDKYYAEENWKNLNYKEQEEKAENIANSLMTKAIIVYIEFPEV
jgi:hypothetical protein